MVDQLIGKCGFYCGSCPSYPEKCLGCLAGQAEGACYTRDCVLAKGINYCGQCREFPCETILIREKVTVLDKAWLRWKKQEN